ncbi:HlyD family type I secretion periplasmic adaptor subunit [Pseudahrensia aquimaris]|uniref:Membrane fusion protein (MFP) family protein n=1 Tax=Pseudahrensia aquimaris TaxID=744461 RepID=A0ABW3FHL0_9HYPH
MELKMGQPSENSVSGAATEAPNTSSDWASRVKTTAGRAIFIGLVTLALFFGGFGYWAANAPLAGAAIAPGIVTASGQNLRIQHLEGGIIEEILVREGDEVVKGQPLIKLDPTEVRSTSNRVAIALVSLRARAERLQAELAGDETLTFSEGLLQQVEQAKVVDLLREQAREFQKRRDRLSTDASIINQSIEAQKERIEGLESQIKALELQSEILVEEIATKRELLRRGLTRKSEINILRRNQADILGRIGSARSAIAESKTAMVEAQERKNKLGADLAEQAVSQLNQVRQEINDLSERGSAAESVLSRMIVRAPADGVIVTAAKNTVGAVVRPGEDLMVLLPTGGELIVEARVNPADKELVKQGQDAKLFFSTLDRRTPEVSGKITYVSVDQVIDPVTNEPYFPARLQIAQELPEGLRQDQIFPGLPVETFIKTGDRTFLEYLVKPISDRFNRAFRES